MDKITKNDGGNKYFRLVKDIDFAGKRLFRMMDFMEIWMAQGIQYEMLC